MAGAVVPTIPRPVELVHPGLSAAGSAFAPVSVYNDWPERIDNASLFEYLVSKDKFGRFVQAIYRCSCAIVYKPVPAESEGKILATGCLIDKDKISTARHAFDRFPLIHLRARFFDYRVRVSHSGQEYVVEEENYIDVPFKKAAIAQNGLDAGYLYLDMEQVPKALQLKYLYVLPRYDKLFSVLPQGHYLMFHFAGGEHRISLGYVHSKSYGMPLHQSIAIQGGPGASGATIIWQGLDGSVFAGGISVYREMLDGNIERRIIPYEQFSKPMAYAIDRVKNPYLYPESFVFNIDPAADSYEFTIWTDDEYQGWRAEHPTDPHNSYAVPANFSNHHIIPIAHLRYLWDYVHQLDDRMIRALEEQAARDIAPANDEIARELAQDLRVRVDYSAPPVEIARQREGLENYARAQVRRTLQMRHQILCQAQLRDQYGRFNDLIIRLTPGGRNDRTWFVWSYWNLFKGWNRDHRTLDPSLNRAKNKHTTRNEKTRPKRLRLELWEAIQELFTAIEAVRRAGIKVPIVDEVLEENLYRSLRRLTIAWEELPPAARQIHPHHADEWKGMGKRYGREQYVLLE